MSIRSYKDSDLDAVLDIYRRSKLDELKFEVGDFELIPLNQDHRRWLKFKDSNVYVYDRNGVVAYCALRENHIESIYVSPEERRKGIARKLLEFMLSKLKNDVSLNVAKNNLPAKSLYQEYGFEVENEFSTSYNGVAAIANKMVLKNNDYKGKPT